MWSPARSPSPRRRPGCSRPPRSAWARNGAELGRSHRARPAPGADPPTWHAPHMPLEVGAEAPDFVLKDQNNQEVRLSDFRGAKNVLLVFYPLAFTGTCQGELCAVRDNLGDFDNDNVQVLTISVDSSPTHKIWAEREGYYFPLL